MLSNRFIRLLNDLRLPYIYIYIFYSDESMNLPDSLVVHNDCMWLFFLFQRLHIIFNVCQWLSNICRGVFNMLFCLKPPLTFVSLELGNPTLETTGKPNQFHVDGGLVYSALGCTGDNTCSYLFLMGRTDNVTHTTDLVEVRQNAPFKLAPKLIVVRETTTKHHPWGNFNPLPAR